MEDWEKENYPCEHGNNPDICKICDTMRREYEAMQDEEFQDRMNYMYTTDEDGFCDGFTKY